VAKEEEVVNLILEEINGTIQGFVSSLMGVNRFLLFKGLASKRHEVRIQPAVANLGFQRGYAAVFFCTCNSV